MALEHLEFGVSSPDRGFGSGSGGADEQNPSQTSVVRPLEEWRTLDTQREDLTREDAKAIAREFFDMDWEKEYGSMKGFFPASAKIGELKDRYPGIQDEILGELMGVDISEYKDGMYKERWWE